MANTSFHGEGMAAYRSTSLFQPHRARQALRDAHEGKIPPLMGLYLGLSSVPVARFIAPMGFDAVWVDWEHSSCNVETMTTMVHEISFMSEGKSIPWVRVPGHDHAAIGFALDAGASLVVPQVNTVEEAKHVISAAKYGTKVGGTRSAPPFRLIPGLTNLPYDKSLTVHQNQNAQAAVMIQIETLEGIDNLDDILTQVPEIDCVWLGTLDIQVSMDLEATGYPRPEPEYQEAVAKFERIMKKHDKPRGGLALGDPESMKKLGKDNCMSFVTADVMAYAQLPAALQTARETFPAERKMVDEPKDGAEQKVKANGQSHNTLPLLS